MYDLKRIEERCNALSAKFGDTFDIPVVLNGRLTRTLGRVTQMQVGKKWQSTKMEISKALLATATDSSIESVIDHEWVHYYITKLTGEYHGHDSEFKRMCAMIGCSNDGTQTRVERTVSESAMYKYTVRCNTCNDDVAFYIRMCSTLKNINECYCKRCGNYNLSVTQNW